MIPPDAAITATTGGYYLSRKGGEVGHSATTFS